MKSLPWNARALSLFGLTCLVGSTLALTGCTRPGSEQTNTTQSETQTRIAAMIAEHGDPIIVITREQAFVLRGVSPAKLKQAGYSLKDETTLMEREGRTFAITYLANGKELLDVDPKGDPNTVVYDNSICEGVPTCVPTTCTKAAEKSDLYKICNPNPKAKACKRKDDGSVCTEKRKDDACERQLYTDAKCSTKKGDKEDQEGLKCN